MDTTKQVRLSEIAELITKGTTPTTLGFDFQDEGINFLKIECFSENGSFMKDKVAHISEECYEKLKRSQLEVGDILFSIAGAIGRVAMVTEEMLPANTNQALSIIRIKRKDIYLPYIKLVLTSSFIKAQFERKKQGVAQLNISLKDISELTIPFPEIDKQREYVTIFDCVLRITSACQQRLQKLDELVKSRFVEMFGDPENNPKHWDKTSLSNVISNANNGMARRGNDAEGSIVLRLVELQDGFIDYSSPNRIVLSEAEKKRYLLKNRDFLFARVNGNPENVGRCAEFSDIGEPVYHNDHIIRVHFDEDLINGCFASALLNSSYGKRQMAGQIKTSAGQYTINQEGIGAIVTVLPPIELQNRFAAFVSEVDKSKLAVKQSLEKLETLKKSLMQQYFG